MTVAGNAQPPAHMPAAFMDADDDFAALEKLPARVREAIQDAPFELSAVSIYDVWLRSQVRVGVSEALIYTLGIIDRLTAEALRG